ncbi:MAG: MFS transporter, partial [Anaerolineales bacterium]|nr:MFS transporter [Anaerolineales bacterium]
FLALVLGGSQALSRSLFSQMIPKNREAEYFSLYEISERGTSWLGPVVFALALQLTGTQRVSIVMLIIFFVVGLILLALTDVKKAITEAGNELPAVV